MNRRSFFKIVAGLILGAPTLLRRRRKPVVWPVKQKSTLYFVDPVGVWEIDGGGEPRLLSKREAWFAVQKTLPDDETV